MLPAYFNDLSIRTKLIAGFLAVSFVALIIGATGYYSVWQTSADTDEIGAVRLPSVQALMDLADAQKSVLLAERGLLIGEMRTPELRRAQYETIDAAFDTADLARHDYAPLPKTPEEDALWTSFVPLWESWKGAHQDVRRSAQEQDRLAATGVDDKDPAMQAAVAKTFQASLMARERYMAAAEPLRQLVELNRDIAEESLRTAESHSAIAATIILLLIVTGLLWAIIVALLVARSIMVQILELTAAAERVSQGDVDAAVAVTSPGTSSAASPGRSTRWWRRWPARWPTSTRCPRRSCLSTASSKSST